MRESEAVQSGLLEDLEDTILMVEGIAGDIVSDIATNIIRQPLIHYTQQTAARYGIPVQSGVESGPLWDPHRHEWFTEFAAMPVTPWGKLLLVPKVIVRQRLTYDPEEYYRYYILPYLQDLELGAQSSLVRLLKSGEARVTKIDVETKYGRGKSTIVSQTRQHPEILSRYRQAKRTRPKAMSHVDLAEASGDDLPDWDALIDAVVAVSPGNDGATAYHRAVTALLAAIFYPSLVSPQIEQEIHEGRKRIDISFVNAATDGFFEWLAMHYPAAHVFAECKNYGREVANPEVDQLAGRFSPSRGQFGLLVCRSFQDKDLFVRRCRDTADDNRGFVVALDDGDLRALVDAGRGSGYGSRQFELLKERFDALVM